MPRRCNGPSAAQRPPSRRFEINEKAPKARRAASLHTPTTLGAAATRDLAAALNPLLADTFALYLKTKNFHWHVFGPHFRDYHLLLDVVAASSGLLVLGG